jgi:flagellar M-ring protein FliF
LVLAEELELEASARREHLRDEVAQLVDNQPDEVAQVIQGWLSQRKG